MAQMSPQKEATLDTRWHPASVLTQWGSLSLAVAHPLPARVLALLDSSELVSIEIRPARWLSADAWPLWELKSIRLSRLN